MLKRTVENTIGAVCNFMNIAVSLAYAARLLNIKTILLTRNDWFPFSRLSMAPVEMRDKRGKYSRRMTEHEGFVTHAPLH